MSSPSGKGPWPLIASSRFSAGNPGASEYDGYGMCYLEFGNDEVARVEVRFVSGQPPSGTYEAPSELLAADKVQFGADRIQRWFDRSWTNTGPP